MHGSGSCNTSSRCVANREILSTDWQMATISIPKKERMTVFECRSIEECVDWW